MQFSLNYRSKYKDKENVEIKIPVSHLGLCIPFIQENLDKRYVIIAEKNVSIVKLEEQAKLLQHITTNYTLQTKDVETFRRMRELYIPCYLNLPVTDWETFDNFIKLGVSDIYIDGPLGFNAEAIISQKKSTKIRVSPQISPNCSIIYQPNEKSFFIRPEDLFLYQKMVDVVDFQELEQEKEDTLYKIYSRGTFDFDLSQLISNLNIKTPNLFIPKEFGQNRLNCKQICKIPGRKCELCSTIFKLISKILSSFDE